MFKATALATFLIAATTPTADADEADHAPKARLDLPETMILPFSPDGARGELVGWTILHKNTETGPGHAQIEHLRRIVRHRGRDLVIVVEIERTRNDGCEGSGERGCPDRLRVLSLPVGFMAVPSGGEIPEGAVLRVLVVPALTG